MSWRVIFSHRTERQLTKMPDNIVSAMQLLVHEIELCGPLRNNWRNFGKLRGGKNRYHCHLKSGRPTYVVCWEVKDKEIKIVEVYYVGTHENAPY